MHRTCSAYDTIRRGKLQVRLGRATQSPKDRLLLLHVFSRQTGVRHAQHQKQNDEGKQHPDDDVHLVDAQRELVVELFLGVHEVGVVVVQQALLPHFALRLAAAKLIQDGKQEMPLIFDDSFVLYDDERLRTALKWLAASCKGQVLLFTCHQREAQMLTANQMVYNYIEL